MWESIKKKKLAKIWYTFLLKYYHKSTDTSSSHQRRNQLLKSYYESKWKAAYLWLLRFHQTMWGVSLQNITKSTQTIICCIHFFLFLLLQNIRLANSNACKCNNSCKLLVSPSLLFFPSSLLYLSTLPSPVFRRRWENHMVRLVQSQKIMGSYSILFCLSEFHTIAESLYFQHPGNSKVFYKSTSPDSYILYGFCYLACEALMEPVVATVSYPLMLPLLNTEMKAKTFFFLWCMKNKTEVEDICCASFWWTCRLSQSRIYLFRFVYVQVSFCVCAL